MTDLQPDSSATSDDHPVLAASGNRIDSPKRTEPRFPIDQVVAVGDEIRAVLSDLAPKAVVAAAAGGADLIILQAAKDLSIPYHVVLSLPIDLFRRRSVHDHGPDWTDTFDRTILAAATVRASDLSTCDDWHLQGNDLILNRAESLAGLCRVVALVVQPPPLTGSTTADFAIRATARNWPIIQIDPLTAKRTTAPN